MSMPTWSFSGGLPETRCGFGSRVDQTEPVRSFLRKVITERGIKTFTDAPCGDFNWMRYCDLSGVHYTGLDNDAGHLAQVFQYDSHPAEFVPASKAIFRADLLTQQVEQADLILCRDFLQHLPHEDVFTVLANFWGSGSSWFLITSHNNPVNDDIAIRGDFRPLNLLAPPYSFPPPREFLSDVRRMLCLWSRDDLHDIMLMHMEGL